MKGSAQGRFQLGIAFFGGGMFQQSPRANRADRYLNIGQAVRASKIIDAVPPAPVRTLHAQEVRNASLPQLRFGVGILGHAGAMPRGRGCGVIDWAIDLLSPDNTPVALQFHGGLGGQEMIGEAIPQFRPKLPG